jgi:hypothetical protein
MGRRSLLLVVLALGFGCVDETHDEQIQALGGETPGVPRGPLHRPGEPCLVCHGGQGPASARFTVAGTVYAIQGQTVPAVGAQVVIEDIRGSSYPATTNAAGNFYVTPGEWAPTYPTQMSVTQGKTTEQMLTHVGREGSCAGCHTDPPGLRSPGPVYVTPMLPGSSEGGP